MKERAGNPRTARHECRSLG